MQTNNNKKKLYIHLRKTIAINLNYSYKNSFYIKDVEYKTKKIKLKLIITTTISIALFFHQMIENYLMLARSSLSEVIKKAIFDVYGNHWITYENILNKISTALPSRKDILKEYENTIKNKCEFIAIDDKCYPTELKMIPSAPIVLSVKGNKQILRKNIVAIAGTREPDIDDFSSIRAVVSTICNCGLVVASGLARGTDCIAHIQSVKSGAIAVMAHGLHMCYPKEHQLLMDKIIENNGVVLSEYSFNQKPNKLNFSKRNRIIVGISNSTVIMRARQKTSGTMISARYAKEFGRHIYTINPCGENKGNFYLLQSKIATQIEDLAEFRYQLMMDCFKKTSINICQNQQIISNLYNNSKNSKIIDDFNVAKKELPSILMSLNIVDVNKNNFSKALSLCKKNTNFSDKNIKQFLLEKLTENK